MSPSKPRIWSAPRRSSSDLINPGANVPELTLFRAEFDRFRLPVCINVFDDSWEVEEFRKWPLLWFISPIDAVMDDLDRVCFVGDSGDGETELRLNGLVRRGDNWDWSIAVLVQ